MERNMTRPPQLGNETTFESFDSYGNTSIGMYEFYAGPQFAFVSTLCAFIIGGNVCVLGAIRLSEAGRKSRMNFFILHLALSDLLVGVFVSFTDLMYKITVEWYAGNMVCKLINFLQGTVTYSSTFMLVSLSIDRYYAVARPMSFSRSGSQAKVLVATAWVASLLFASPNFFLYSEETRSGKRQCWIDFPGLWHWQIFFTIIALVTFFIPTIIIASCYIAIIYIIWSKGTRKCNSKLRYHWLGKRTGSPEPDRHMTINDSRHDTGKGIIPQAKIRTIKMTLIIVIVFVLCWCPYFLYNLLELYERIPANDPLSTFFQSAAPLNSAANPIIYGIFSTRICRNLRRIPVHPCIRNTFCCCKDTGGRDHYYNSTHTKAYRHNNTEPSTSTGNRNGTGRRSCHHDNQQKHTSVIVTANKKGYSCHRVTQFDSVLNIESSTTMNSNERFTHLEMSLVQSKSDKSCRRNFHPTEKSNQADLCEYVKELSPDKSRAEDDNSIVNVDDDDDDEKKIYSSSTTTSNNYTNFNKALKVDDLVEQGGINEGDERGFLLNHKAKSCQNFSQPSEAMDGTGFGDLVIVYNEDDVPLKSIASRRSSGIPVVKNKLTANDNEILNHVMRKFAI